MARDIIHDAVKEALIKDKWDVEDDYTIRSGGVGFDIDLSAEKVIVAERGVEQILVEVKSFGDPSLIYSFHSAIGQYLDYRGALKDEGIDLKLYLAISEKTYIKLMKAPFFRRRLEEHKVKQLIVNVESKTIVKWIE